MSDFFQSIIDVLRAYVNDHHNGNVSSAARALNVGIQTLHTWLNGTRRPQLAKISPVLEELKATVVLPSNLPAAPQSREICFVNAKVVPAGEHIAPPQAEDYIAAPMVGEVGAGRGYIAQDDVESWFLVYKHALPAAHSKDLFAVKIGPLSVSMQPTLNPGDIVLVDKEVQHVEAFLGRMMLVKEPDKESGMIKRVELTPAKDDTLITFYSDNAARFRPMVYSLRDEYDGDLNNAIVGRVIWAWSDVRNK